MPGGVVEDQRQIQDEEEGRGEDGDGGGEDDEPLVIMDPNHVSMNVCASVCG